MRLWLDDLRDPPDATWTRVTTVADAQAALERGDVRDASLDNDLGDGELEGRRLVFWMCENDTWPSESLAVHSANPEAWDYMFGMIERYGPFRRASGTHRFERVETD